MPELSERAREIALILTDADEPLLARREGRDHEPASVLLERIMAQREKAGTGKRPTTAQR